MSEGAPERLARAEQEKTVMDKPPTGAAFESEGRERRAAFAALLEANEPALLGAARRMCGGNEDQAQDLAQEAIIKAYSAFITGKFQQGTNARAWLLRILTNGFINAYHRKQRWEDPGDFEALTRDGAMVPETLRAPNADQPEAALLASTLDEPLERALVSLPPELRICIELVDIGAMDYEEAARTLQVPIGTVRSRLFRGRQQLHRVLYRYAEQHRLSGGQAS